LSADEQSIGPDATPAEPQAPSEDRGPAGDKAQVALTVAIVIYALVLAALTVDKVLDLGWYPTKLDRRVRGLIQELGSPDVATRSVAAAELERGEAFVVIPALIRALDAPDERTRGEAAELLQSLTAEHLSGDLMGFRADASPEERGPARQKLWEWWEFVREDF